jgi:hypothetical protein
MFQPAKRSQVQTLMTTLCLDDVNAQLPSLGKTASDFYDSTFVNSVSLCGIGISDCTDSPASIWKPRFLADRPPIASGGPPILIWYGGMDTTIAPGFQQCELDKLNRDLAQSSGATTSVSTCLDPDATHTSLPSRDVQFVNQWIGARATGDAEPGCAPLPTGDGGVTCTTPPPND